MTRLLYFLLAITSSTSTGTSTGNSTLTTFNFEGEKTLYPPFSGAQLDWSDIYAWEIETEAFFGEVGPSIHVSFAESYQLAEENEPATNSLPIRFDLHASYPADMDTFKPKELVSIILSAFESYEKEEGYDLGLEQRAGNIGSDEEIQIDLEIHVPTLSLQAHRSAIDPDMPETPNTPGTIMFAVMMVIFIIAIIAYKFQRCRSKKSTEKDTIERFFDTDLESDARSDALDEVIEQGGLRVHETNAEGESTT